MYTLLIQTVQLKFNITQKFTSGVVKYIYTPLRTKFILILLLYLNLILNLYL